MIDRWVDHTHRTLRAGGLRTGGGRELVLRELSRTGCLVSAHDLEMRLREQGERVSLTTIYRTLETLHAHGLVMRVDCGEGVARYEPIGPGVRAHHHSVCDRCGVVLPFEDPVVDEALAAAVRQLPFHATHADVVVHGACADCACRPSPAARTGAGV